MAYPLEIIKQELYILYGGIQYKRISYHKHDRPYQYKPPHVWMYASGITITDKKLLLQLEVAFDANIF